MFTITVKAIGTKNIITPNEPGTLQISKYLIANGVNFSHKNNLK